MQSRLARQTARSCHSAGAGPKASRALSITPRPIARFPAPPMTAPTPAGRSLPRTRALRLAAYLVTNLRTREVFIVFIVPDGIRPVDESRPVGRGDSGGLLDDLHSGFAQRHGQDEGATLLVVDGGDAVNGRDREREQCRGLEEECGLGADRGDRRHRAHRGTAAVAPTALPLPVTALRNIFSMRATICAGVSSGWARRTRSTYFATAGPAVGSRCPGRRRSSTPFGSAYRPSSVLTSVSGVGGPGGRQPTIWKRARRPPNSPLGWWWRG